MEDTQVNTQARRPQLIFDGECPLCRRTVRLLIKAKLIDERHTLPFEELSGEAATRVWEAGIKNELIAVDLISLEVKSGIDGIFWIISERIPSSIRFLSITPIISMIRVAYRIVSYNRRVISPTGKTIACECDPDPSPLYNTLFIAVCILFAALITALVGADAIVLSGLGEAAVGAVNALITTGISWVLLMTASFMLEKGRRVLYVSHLAATMAVGAAVLAPAVLFALFAPKLASLIIYILSALLSILYMLRMQQKRLVILGLSVRWLHLWVVCIIFAVLIWVLLSLSCRFCSS